MAVAPGHRLFSDARAGTPEQLRERPVADIAKWRAVIKKANIPRQ